MPISLRLISILTILVALFFSVGHGVIRESRTRQEKCGIREDRHREIYPVRFAGSCSDVLDARGAVSLPPRGHRRLSPRSFRSLSSPLSENARGERVICVGNIGGIFFIVAYSGPGFNSKLRSRV